MSHLKLYHLQEGLSHLILSFLNLFFCILETLHILLFCILQSGAVCLQSNFWQTYTAHGNGQCLFLLKKAVSIEGYTKEPVCVLSASFSYSSHFLKLFFEGERQKRIKRSPSESGSVIKPVKIMVASSLLGELTLSTPFRSYRPFADGVLKVR